jgi:hypothetical protein
MNSYLKNIFIIFILCQSILTVQQTYELAYEHNPDNTASTQFIGNTSPIQVSGPIGVQNLTRLKGNVTLKNNHPLDTPTPKYMLVEGQFAIFTVNQPVTPTTVTINVSQDSNGNIGQIYCDQNQVDSGSLYTTYDKHSGHVTGVKRQDFIFTKIYHIDGNQSVDDDSRLDINVDASLTTVTTAVRYIKVSYYSCHPTCNDCDPITGNCNACAAMANTNGVDMCTCTQQDNLFSVLFKITFQCVPNSDTNCSVRTFNKVRDFCQTCADTMFMRNYIDLSVDARWSSCVCPNSLNLAIVNNSVKCITGVEYLCMLYSGVLSDPDINQIRSFTDNLSTNVKLMISAKIDPVFDEKYFLVEPVISSLPPFTSVPLAFKLSIKDISQTNEIFNILGNNQWTYYDVTGNTSNGINIRKSDIINNKLDCVATQIQNGAQTWKCNIWLAVYNPCSGAVYAKTKTTITLSEGGLAQASFNINQTTANITALSCIVNNECFYNEKYSSSLFACNSDLCSDQRVTQYAPGDYVYLKPTVNYQGTPGNFSIGVEYAAFIYKDANGNEVNTFNAMTELKTVNGGAIIGFRIPAATELIDQYGVTSTGSLYLSFVIRINNPINLRRLEETRYSLTAANPILIKLDPKYFDTNYVDENGKTSTTDSNSTDGSTNNTIVIVVVVLAVALVITTVIVSLIILKKRKQHAGEKPVPSHTPNDTCHEKPVDAKEVKIEFGN